MEITIESVKERNIKVLTDCIEEKKDDNENIRFYCCIKNCDCDFRDKTNAIRHIRLNHFEIHNLIKSNKERKLQDEEKQEKFIELRVRVNVKEIWEACVDLITVNALPIAVVESPAFKKILQPYVTALRRQGIELNINKRSIKLLIEEKANRIKKQIISETKGGLVDLMVDIATRHNRSVLGINIKYMIDGTPVIRTIGMHTLHFASTAANLRNIIVGKLKEYELNLENIFSITTDNGANVLKAVAEINEEYQKERNVTIVLQNEIEDASIHEISDEEIDMDIFDEDYYIDLLNNLRLQFGNLDYSNLIMGLSCAAHCLHNVVKKAIEKSSATEQLLKRVRELVKKLRSPTFRNLITSLGLNQAILDVPTRWNSIFGMLIRLTELHEYCKTLTEDRRIQQHLLNDEEWNDIDKLIALLEPFYIHTIKLQSNSCTLSDFYGYWMTIKFKLNKLNDDGTCLRTLLLQEMEQYTTMLLDNPVIIAAVFLDTRYQISLNAEKKKVAISFLAGLHKRVTDLKKQTEIEPDAQLAINNDRDDFRNFLCSMRGGEEAADARYQERISQESEILNQLKSFSGTEIPSTASILQYWRTQKYKNPLLYALACIIFSVPPTQTSVERAFSALAIVLSPRRTRLSDKTLQNILLVRLNQSLLLALK